MDKTTSNLAKALSSAMKRKASLDAGRARRKLIAIARESGTHGWPKWLVSAVTDERGNLLPSGGYADEQEQ